LTDDPEIDFCPVIPLKHDWPGWWSKIELFRKDLWNVPVLYLDLDTVILGNIDPLLYLAQESFIVLRGFNHKFCKLGKQNFASGIMAGHFYEHSYVYESFCKSPELFISQPRENWMHGDQGFIADLIGVDNIPRLQERLHKDFIVGKRALRNRPIPAKAKIVAWSGSPRLHELEKAPGIIVNELNQYWKKYD
jgi:hypothetical protein